MNESIAKVAVETVCSLLAGKTRQVVAHKFLKTSAHNLVAGLKPREGIHAEEHQSAGSERMTALRASVCRAQVEAPYSGPELFGEFSTAEIHVHKKNVRGVVITTKRARTRFSCQVGYHSRHSKRQAQDKSTHTVA